MFEINKNVPITNSRTEWPFRLMEVGDSIDIHNRAIVWKRAIANAHNIGRKRGWKFKASWLEDHGTIWRVK